MPGNKETGGRKALFWLRICRYSPLCWGSHGSRELETAGPVVSTIRGQGLTPFSHFYAVQNPSPQHTAMSTEKKNPPTYLAQRRKYHRCTWRFISQEILDHLKIKFSIHHCRWKCVSMFPRTGMKLSWRNSQISPLFFHHLSISMTPKPFLSHLSSSSASSSLSLTDPKLLPLEDVENNQSFFFKKYSVPGGGSAHF